MFIESRINPVGRADPSVAEKALEVKARNPALFQKDAGFQFLVTAETLTYQQISNTPALLEEGVVIPVRSDEAMDTLSQLNHDVAIKVINNPKLAKDPGFKAALRDSALDAYSNLLRSNHVPEEDVIRMVTSRRDSLIQRNGVLDFARNYFATSTPLENAFPQTVKRTH